MLIVEAQELSNRIKIILNRAEDRTPESKEYIDGMREIVNQILRVIDESNRVTERQSTALKNLLQSLSRYIH